MDSTYGNSSPSVGMFNRDYPQGKFSLSSWSVNLLSGARDRITNLTHSLAALSTEQRSWSPPNGDDANNNPRHTHHYYHQRQSPKYNRGLSSTSSSPESTGLYVYSIEDFSTMDSGHGTSSIASSSLVTQRSTQSLHSIGTAATNTGDYHRHNNHHRHKPSSSSSAAKFYRRSPLNNRQNNQRLYSGPDSALGIRRLQKTVIGPDYGIQNSVHHQGDQSSVILSVDNLNAKLSLNPINDSKPGRRSKTRRHHDGLDKLGRKQGGSLESVDLEEDEDEDDDDVDDGFFRGDNSPQSSSSSSSSSGSCTPDLLSQSPTFAMLNSPDFGPDIGLHMSNKSGSDTPTLNESFARHMGYQSLANVMLYSELLTALDARAKFQKQQQNHPEQQQQQQAEPTRPRGCAKYVPRFGLGYEDGCHFPLVLSVFVNECLSSTSNKKRPTNTFVTWETINLMADAELSRWEMSALNNLSKNFYSVPILGMPTRYITPDPNFFLRNLLKKLSAPNSGSKSSGTKLANFERNRSLKRWNSFDDLIASDSSVSDPEFRISESSSVRTSFSSSSSSSLVKSLTDDCLVMSSPNFSSSSPVTTTTTTTNLISSTLSKSSAKNHRQVDGAEMSKSKSQFQELLTRLNSTSCSQFACYLTKQYLQLFRSDGFNVSFLAQLVLHKDIGTVGGQSPSAEMATFVRTLLTFDDCLVSAIGAYVRQQTSSVSRQAAALATLIEICCILRQMGNFYALSIVVGSIQSPANYRMTEAWLHLSYHHPYHFSDYKRLCRFTRRVDVSILGNGSSFGVQSQIIPTLPALLNRLRLYCAGCWDLYEAKRRFNLHPSLADWINTEVIISRRSFKSNHTGNGHCLPVSERATRLIFDPIRETFLGNDGPNIRLMSYEDFPINWTRQRNVASMPERFVRRLLNDFGQSSVANLFQVEIDNISVHYVLPNLGPAQTGDSSSLRTRHQPQYQLRQNSL